MVDVQERYEELVRLAREDVLLESIAATLEWDEETHMPRAGADNRARQQALLAGLKLLCALALSCFDGEKIVAELLQPLP